MPEIYSIWIVIVFLVAVIVYAWNENRLWRKEIKRIDHLDSYEEKNTDLLRLLVSITGAVLIAGNINSNWEALGPAIAVMLLTVLYGYFIKAVIKMMLISRNHG